MSRTRVDAAVEELLRRIVGGTYPTGAALPGEASLASDLSVSRLTAREATKVLATRGVLSARQGSGTYVNDPASWQDLGSLAALARRDGSEREVGLALLEVRRMIEVGSAGLAAARITADRLDAMEAAIAELRRADADDDVDAAVGADLAFHDHIVRAASNPFIGVTFAPLRDELVVARPQRGAGPRRGPARAHPDGAAPRIPGRRRGRHARPHGPDQQRPAPVRRLTRPGPPQDGPAVVGRRR